ncbi:MAG: ASCH domain-containing protein [Dokdonella sp.]
MIALSIRQPWASFIVTGVPVNGEPPIFKDVENREWTTPFRGRCLIHASKGGTKREFAAAIAGVEEAFGLVVPLGFDDFARGGIIGSVEIVGCVRNSSSPWFTGLFGFLLADPRVLPFRAEPGRLGFFNTEDHHA